MKMNMFYVVKNRDGLYYHHNLNGPFGHVPVMFLFKTIEQAQGFASYGARIVEITVEENKIFDEGYWE